MFEWFADPTAWLGLGTLVIIEIVLGIDNLVFIAILSDKLPPHQRDKARIVGLSLALGMRLVLLASISWMATLTEPLATVMGQDFSGRDLIFLFGGLFLLFKATKELHERLEGRLHGDGKSRHYARFWPVIAQIVVLDAVFSIDSVITAVGMTEHLSIMMMAVIVAIILMMVASKRLTRFVNARPTVIILCLGFLMMIGFSLIAEGVGFHIPKGYLYAAIGFSVLVEAFNQAVRAKRTKAFGALSLRERTADAVLRLLGGKVEGQADPAIEDIVAAEASQDDAFEPEERRMLERVLRLHDVSVASVMTHRQDVIWIDVDEDRASIEQKIREYRHARYPLCEGSTESPLGVIVVKDLLLNPAQADLRALVRPPISLPESATALEALSHFKQSTSGFAVVLDEHGALEGVVTLKDIMEAIVGTLPEPDYREDYTGVKQEDGSWLLDGGLGIHEVEEMLGADHMTNGGDYSTLAGFVLHELGQIPTMGASFVWNDWRFTVDAMERNRVTKVVAVREENLSE
jgi:CBS domain containing-hemolysin-like protein